MHVPGQFATILAMAYGIALLAWSMLRLFSFHGSTAYALGIAVMTTPLVVPASHVSVRAVACVLAVDLFFRITDYATHQRSAACADRTFASYALFLIPFPVFLVRFGQRVHRSRSEFTRGHQTALALLAFCSCCALLRPLSHWTVLQTSFVLDHTVKFILFAFAIEMLARFIHGLEHLAGFDTRPLINNAFMSETVGEFWYRYNTRIHSWFEYNVFRPFRGMRSPGLAIFLTFFVSAIIHELGFAIATMRSDGYQFVFFMMQAPAVILGHVGQRIATTPMAKIGLRSSTILWMWLTSMLFFHGVNQVFSDFYASTPWLP